MNLVGKEDTLAANFIIGRNFLAEFRVLDRVLDVAQALPTHFSLKKGVLLEHVEEDQVGLFFFFFVRRCVQNKKFIN